MVDLRSLPDRIWPRVRKTQGCWIWRGYIGNHGYGTITYQNQRLLIHRLIWFVYHGEMPPKNLFVCHHCDNKRCVRKEHLFLGTASDNARDASEKGLLRGNRGKCFGETHGRAKLTWDKVAEIRRMKGTNVEIAKKFGVSNVTISLIRRGKGWPEHRAP